MPNVETCRALLAKVEEAKGGSRELDREIHTALGFAMGKVIHDGPLWNSYTTSIDAALALVAKVLPKWSLRISTAEGYRHPNIGMARSYPTNRAVTVEHHTPSLAIIYAMLKALLIEAEETAHVER